MGTDVEMQLPGRNRVLCLEIKTICKCGVGKVFNIKLTLNICSSSSSCYK